MNKENTFLAYPSEFEEKCKFYVYMEENNRLYYLNKEYEKKLEDKNQEINRLNNIINELEKDLNEAYDELHRGELVNGRELINNIYQELKELKDR